MSENQQRGLPLHELLDIQTCVFSSYDLLLALLPWRQEPEQPGP